MSFYKQDRERVRKDVAEAGAIKRAFMKVAAKSGVAQARQEAREALSDKYPRRRMQTTWSNGRSVTEPIETTRQAQRHNTRDAKDRGRLNRQILRALRQHDRGR